MIFLAIPDTESARVTYALIGIFGYFGYLQVWIEDPQDRGSVSGFVVSFSDRPDFNFAVSFIYGIDHPDSSLQEFEFVEISQVSLQSCGGDARILKPSF